MTAREADVFACLAHTVIAPTPDMPPVARTDAKAFLKRYLAASPRPNRIGLRALLYALEAGPVLLGYGRRLRRLTPAERIEYVDRLDRSRVRLAAEALEAVAELAYYGDDGVMRAMGYDADAVVARARELRLQEARW